METFKDELFDQYLVFLIFTVVGIFELLIIGFIKAVRKRRAESWQKTNATVTNVVTRRGSKGSTLYHPVFEFVTYMNEKVSKQSMFGSSTSVYKVGDIIEVLYNPQKPTSFQVVNDKRLKLAFTIVTIVAVVFLVVGIIGLYPLYQKYYGQ